MRCPGARLSPARSPHESAEPTRAAAGSDLLPPAPLGGFRGRAAAGWEKPELQPGSAARPFSLPGQMLPLGPGRQSALHRRRCAAPDGTGGARAGPGRGRRDGSPAPWAPRLCHLLAPGPPPARAPVPCRCAAGAEGPRRGGRTGTGGPGSSRRGHGTLAWPLWGCRPGKTMTWQQWLAWGHGPPWEQCAAWVVLGQAAVTAGACCQTCPVLRPQSGSEGLAVPMAAPRHGMAQCHPCSSGTWGLVSVSSRAGGVCLPTAAAPWLLPAVLRPAKLSAACPIPVLLHHGAPGRKPKGSPCCRMPPSSKGTALSLCGRVSRRRVGALGWNGLGESSVLKCCVPTGPTHPTLQPHCLGLCASASRQHGGQAAWGSGVAAPGDPVLMDLELLRSGSHCQEEKHSQGRAMGKGPPLCGAPSHCLTAQPGIPGCSCEEPACILPKRGVGQRPFCEHPRGGVCGCCGYVAMGTGGTVGQMREAMACLVGQRCASCWASLMASLGCQQDLGGQGWVLPASTPFPLHRH